LTDIATRQNETIAAVMKSIRRISRATDMRSKRVARDTGLTLPQIVLLQAVRDLGELTTAAISRQIDLSPATVVTILDKLEARGLVERRRSTVDRRIVHTRLTDEGARILAAAPPLFPDHFVRGFAALPETEQARVVQAFRTVADLLDPEQIAFSAADPIEAGPIAPLPPDPGLIGERQ